MLIEEKKRKKKSVIYFYFLEADRTIDLQEAKETVQVYFLNHDNNEKRIYP